MSYDFTQFKKDELTKPRDKAWDNWAKFENVGDSVQGYIRDVFFRESEGDFKEQRGITLEQPNGELINVAIKQIDFILAKTDSLRLGDPLTVVLEKTTPSSQKGYSPTKIHAYYGKNLPENAGNKTVAELEAIDRGLVLAAAEEAKVAKEAAETTEPATQDFPPEETDLTDTSSEEVAA